MSFPARALLAGLNRRLAKIISLGEVRSLSKEIARLRAEVATYKHAFETTVADRERLKKFLESRQRVILELERERDQYRHAFETTAVDRDRIRAETGFYEPEPDVAPGSADTAVDVALYGPLWSGALYDIKKTVGSKPVDHASFTEVICQGGFSQYTMYRNREFLGALVDWQLDVLEKAGMQLRQLEPSLAESSEMPAHLLFQRQDRQVSADFLRLVFYLGIVRNYFPADAGSRLIVEIGSGYGGFTRLLKLVYPDATICLFDLPDCLRVAQYFLQSAFPDAGFAWVGTPQDVVDTSDADFILVPCENAAAFKHQKIDLVINTWSFGEMPNAQIRKWFDLIEKHNQTKQLFLLNHFLFPVHLTPGNISHQASHYNWLTQPDSQWRVLHFEINPAIHRAPMVTHEHQGIALIMERCTDEQAQTQERDRAQNAVRSVHLHDWVQASVLSDRKGAGGHEENRHVLFGVNAEATTNGTHFALERFEQTTNLWRPDYETTIDGTFFRLWNDIRLNRTPLSIRLMRIWLHLRYRPAFRSRAGRAVDLVSREEIHYGLLESGRWAADAKLEIPSWLDRHLCGLCVEDAD